MSQKALLLLKVYSDSIICLYKIVLFHYCFNSELFIFISLIYIYSVLYEKRKRKMNCTVCSFFKYKSMVYDYLKVDKHFVFFFLFLYYVLCAFVMILYALVQWRYNNMGDISTSLSF